MWSEVLRVRRDLAIDNKGSLAVRVDVQGGQGEDQDIEKKDSML